MNSVPGVMQFESNAALWAALLFRLARASLAAASASLAAR